MSKVSVVGFFLQQARDTEALGNLAVVDEREAEDHGVSIISSPPNLNSFRPGDGQKKCYSVWKNFIQVASILADEWENADTSLALREIFFE